MPPGMLHRTKHLFPTNRRFQSPSSSATRWAVDSPTQTLSQAYPPPLLCCWSRRSRCPRWKEWNLASRFADTNGGVCARLSALRRPTKTAPLWCGSGLRGDSGCSGRWRPNTFSFFVPSPSTSVCCGKGIRTWIGCETTRVSFRRTACTRCWTSTPWNRNSRWTVRFWILFWMDWVSALLVDGLPTHHPLTLLPSHPNLPLLFCLLPFAKECRHPPLGRSLVRSGFPNPPSPWNPRKEGSASRKTPRRRRRKPQLHRFHTQPNPRKEEQKRRRPLWEKRRQFWGWNPRRNWVRFQASVQPHPPGDATNATWRLHGVWKREKQEKRCVGW